MVLEKEDLTVTKRDWQEADERAEKKLRLGGIKCSGSNFKILEKQQRPE